MLNRLTPLHTGAAAAVVGIKRLQAESHANLKRVRWQSAVLACALLAAQSTGFAGPAGPAVPELPAPGAGAFRRAVVIDWGEQVPTAPPGFVVERFSDELDHPRWLYVLPNDDVLVSQARTETMGGFAPGVVEELTKQGLFGPSPNTIVLLRADESGVSQHVLLDNLRQPFGMVLLDDWLYVANTDSLVRYPFRVGQTRIDAAAELIAALPAGERTGDWNNHWTRNVVVEPGRQDTLCISRVGDGCRCRGQRTTRASRDLAAGSGWQQPAVVCDRPAQPDRHGFRTANRRAVGHGERTRRAGR